MNNSIEKYESFSLTQIDNEISNLKLTKNPSDEQIKLIEKFINLKEKHALMEEQEAKTQEAKAKAHQAKVKAQEALKREKAQTRRDEADADHAENRSWYEPMKAIGIFAGAMVGVWATVNKKT